MNLQELANLPHGEASKRLKELGHWDEWAGMEEREYQVTVQYQYCETDTTIVTVTARHQDEAEEKAIDDVECDCDVIPDSAEVIMVKEV